MNLHILVPSSVDPVKRVATLRTEITLDIDAVMLFNFSSELMRNQVQGLFMHWTIFDGIDRPSLGLCPILKTQLEHIDNGRFATADRSHQQEYSFTDFQSLRSRFEIFDYARDRLFNTEEL